MLNASKPIHQKRPTFLGRPRPQTCFKKSQIHTSPSHGRNVGPKPKGQIAGLLIRVCGFDSHRMVTRYVVFIYRRPPEIRSRAALFVLPGCDSHSSTYFFISLPPTC